MSADTGAVVAVRIPQVNVNDEEVTFVAWKVEDGGRAVEGEPLCEIETSKSVGELPSPATGVLRQTVHPGSVIRIDAVIGYIGPSAAVVDSHLSSLKTTGGPASAHPAAHVPAAEAIATTGAIEFARRAGIDITLVPSTEGRVRLGDVERYLIERGLSVPGPGHAAGAGHPAQAMADDVLPPGLQNLADETEALSNHQWSIAQHLTDTQNRVVTAHLLMDVDMTRAMEWVAQQRQRGLMASPLPILLKAAGMAVAANRKLADFRIGRRVFRYRAVHVAFTARSNDGWLFTPVVHNVDATSLEDLAGRCNEMAMAAFRGQLESKDLNGGCITVSLLNDQPVRCHIGLQNLYQTAIITAGAVRDEVKLVNGKPAAVPTLTLAMSYDHGVMDGWDAAVALNAARQAIETMSW